MSPERAEKHRQINARPKRCPQCGQVVQASNLARHIRREGERYRRSA
jgi:ribosomal protein S27AE